MAKDYQGTHVVFDGVECKADTKLAIFVTIDGTNYTFPKSEIHDDSEVYAKDTDGKLIVSKWIARERGFEVDR